MSAIVALGGVSAISGALAGVFVQLPLLSGSGNAYVPALVFVPLLSACVIGIATYSPFGELEISASRPLPAYRFFHIALLFSIAAGTLGTMAYRWELMFAAATLVRNLAGFTGLAMLGSALIGGRLSWLFPLAFGLVTYQLGAQGPERFATWAWPLAHPTDIVGGLSAVGLVCVGVAVYGFLGDRLPSNGEQGV